jgi:hypothetical protein
MIVNENNLPEIDNNDDYSIKAVDSLSNSV